MTIDTPRYDRRAASRILATLARDGLFDGETTPPAPRVLEYSCATMRPEPGSHLNYSQRLYLERFMRPCQPYQVTTATHRMAWTDSDGVPNTGHYRADGLGPVVPIAARETVLALWHSLRDNADLAERAAALGSRDRAVLEGTTTDHEPLEIFRVGLEATGRALAQHALLARQTPYREPVEFAKGMADSGIFAAVATRWFWELQASTYRRGMIPVTLATQPDGTVRYTAESVATLRAMKDATIAEAHTVMRRATTVEGLDVAAALAKYHEDLDLISRQYALLPPSTRPACLAAMPHRLDGEHYSILPEVVDRFVAVFAAVVAAVRVREIPVEQQPNADAPGAAADEVFYVPDMNCKHCVRTITGILTGMGLDVLDIDLLSKRVVTEFRSPRNRARAFEALRDGGYNPVAERPDPAAAEAEVPQAESAV
ncbi:heavy-metal-associated domain-containing protein [Nocardia puris]|uniref:Copper chaperone CopZ n=1 Tax=Nocardia puris TaxID=208602 RepID=A0A366DUU6_9NOCA|nr:heavy-metal-associated domain-containing protein [Nocardia puris]MBF6210446.1 heavy-metal-associated domain-containing protein [Nocardia puris]MBF6367521.1 heavy-metal-associated domain-containing protein [Nocardia puris]MBF6457706.1 heavy-metal-associated domain-containing protein [Nocardia puris]RBO93871.1 copper chaperone CopZ [Nocardia puris]